MASKNSKTNNIYINGKQAGQTLNDLRKESRKLNNEINQMAPGTEAYKKKIQELGGVKKQLTDHRNELKKVEGSYTKVKSSMGGIKALAGNFLGAGAIIGAVTGIVRGAGEWIKTNAKLSSSLSSLKALTGASAKDLEFYKKEAIRMGASTTQTGTQVVDAMKLIGSAKPELLQSKEALSEVTEETIRLAEAGQIELTTAADSLTGALNQWGKGAESAGRFTNVLAAGSKSGAADIASLGQSIDKSGAVMAGYNVQIEEGVGLLETLAEKNIKGAEAGTALRNMLLRMQGVDALPKEALAQLEKFGVDLEIVKDKTLPLNTRLEEMAKIGGDTTAMMKVFGLENTVAATAILQNTDKVQKFTESVTDTNVALEQQKINNDNLNGDLKSLSSAWEGLTLTIGGGEGALRKIVQTGTKALNWVIDITNAFVEWDITKINTQLLKLLNTVIDMTTVFWKLIPGLGSVIESFQDMISEQIRYNELTSAVIDGMKEQQRSLSILSSSLQENKSKLEDANTTEEEAIALKEENAKIIDKLNDKFPELTKNIDLQSASNEELTNWTKQASQAILESAIAEAKAAEQKRIINAIIEESIALRQQEAKEAQRWALTNWFADIFADDAEDMRKNIEKSKGQLENLEETFKQVEGTVKSLDLNFVIDFETANQAIEAQATNIKALRAEIKKATKEGTEAQLQALRAQLKGEEAQLDAALQRRNEIKDEELRELEEIEIKATEEKNAKIAKINADNAKAQRKEFEKLLKELEKLSEFEQKINEEKNREISLANKTELEKELLQTEYKIQDKYAKEIASATELAKQKGEIGERAADQLAMIQLLKDEELMNARLAFKEKEAEEIKEQQIKADKERIAAQLMLEEAYWNTKKTVLQMRLDETKDWEIMKRREIMEEISNLERERANSDFEKKKEELQLKLEDETLTKIDHDLLLEELEIEHQDRLTEIQAEAIEQRKALDKEQIQNVLDQAQSAVDLLTTLKDADFEMTKNGIEKEKNERIKALEIALNKNEITQRDYDKSVAKIEENAEARKKAAMIEEFERQKKLSLLQVAINTATAIMKAIAQFGPPPSPLGIAGIAAAGIIGISQGAVIMSQQAPQFKDGGYTTVTGADDGKTYNAKNTGRLKAGMIHGGPQMVLVNENRPEYFIPDPMLRHPEVIDHVRAIENIRVRQFAEGGATAQLPEQPQVKTVSTEGTQNQMQLAEIIQQNTLTMQALLAASQNLSVTIGDDKIDQLQDKMEEMNKISA